MADENEKKVVSFGKAEKIFRRQMDDPWIEILHVSSVSKKMTPCSFRTAGITLEDAGDNMSLIILQSGETVRLSLPYVALMDKIYEGYSPIDLKEYSNPVVPAPEAGEKMADGSVFVGLTDDGKQQIYAMPADLAVTMAFNAVARAVDDLNANKALGHDDWQIPAKEALQVLRQNKDKGALAGTFCVAARGDVSSHPDWYWSSTMKETAYAINFIENKADWCSNNSVRLSCRPVRLVPVF